MSMPRFVIQKHYASRLHYDLRLEMGEVLKSWAVPKEPVADTKVRRLAIQVADHEPDYINFEGVIEDGHYGAGRVEIWDSGTYELIEEEGSGEAILRFRLSGKRLRGPWKLVHMNWPPGGQWLLCASRGAEKVEPE